MIRTFLAAAVLVASATAAQATFIFDFTETAIVARGTCAYCSVGPITPTPLPLSFTVSDPTGSARYSEHEDARITSDPPVVSDPDFAFTTSAGILPGPLTISGPGFGAGLLGISYDFEWTTLEGQLTALSLVFHVAGTSTAIGLPGDAFGLTGGLVGSDGSIGGCADGSCIIAGFWTATVPPDTPVPEPASLVILAGALGAFGFIRRRKTATAPS